MSTYDMHTKQDIHACYVKNWNQKYSVSSSWQANPKGIFLLQAGVCLSVPRDLSLEILSSSYGLL